MELQQYTNLKSVNIKQLIRCNKNAVYMTPTFTVSVCNAYSDDYILCYRYNKADSLTCKQTNIICYNNCNIFYIKSILHVRPPLKQTKDIMLCYHIDCFSLTKITYEYLLVYFQNIRYKFS